jgi:hypothetical protein
MCLLHPQSKIQNLIQLITRRLLTNTEEHNNKKGENKGTFLFWKHVRCAVTTADAALLRRSEAAVELAVLAADRPIGSHQRTDRPISEITKYWLSIE